MDAAVERESPWGLDRRVSVVAGKGGVGKSTISAALAVASARAGLKTLVLGCDAREGLSQALGTDALAYRERKIEENLWGATITGRESLEEFLKIRLKVKALYDRLLHSDLFQYFVAAAPGLDELFILGKIWFLCQQTERGRKELQFDRVVFDAPATGHGVSLLKTPQVMMEMIPMGPIHQNSRMIAEMFTDPEQVALHIVTLLEEMPVNEAIELDRTVRTEIHTPRGSTFVNGLYPDVVPEGLVGLWEDLREDPRGRARDLGVDLSPDLAEALVHCAETISARRSLADVYLGKLVESVPGAIATVPYFFRIAGGRELTEAVAAALVPQVGAGAFGGSVPTEAARQAGGYE